MVRKEWKIAGERGEERLRKKKLRNDRNGIGRKERTKEE
jgi:hypothetical protein